MQMALYNNKPYYKVLCYRNILHTEGEKLNYFHFNISYVEMRESVENKLNRVRVYLIIKNDQNYANQTPKNKNFEFLQVLKPLNYRMSLSTTRGAVM